MKNCLVTVLVAIFLCFLCEGILADPTHSIDQAALLEIWRGWTNNHVTGWDTTTGLCGQEGVFCTNEKVTKFWPSFDKSLQGTISSEIGRLTSLTNIQLTGNNFTGTLPTEIGFLVNVNMFALSGPQSFTGPIPSEFGLLSHLTYLDLSQSHLTGTIPSSLEDLPNLIILYLLGIPEVGNNFCPMVDYSGWVAEDGRTDYPGTTNCTACSAAFDTCQNGGTCIGGTNETFSCECLEGSEGVNCQLLLPAPTEEPTDPPTDEEGLSPGAVIGICVGSAGVLLLTGGLVWFCWGRRKRQGYASMN